MIKHHIRAAKKILTKADIILILILLVLAVSLLSMIRSKNENGIAYIYLHNELVKEIELTDEQKTIIINQDITLEIQQRKIRVLHSNCHEQICVKQGWSANLPIVCVPNELLIVIKRTNSQEKMLITS